MSETFARRLFIFSLTYLMFTMQHAAAEQSKLIPIAQSTIKTEYFDLATSEYKIDDRPKRAGGALLVDGGGLIVASADGDFIRIDPKTSLYQTQYLPSLTNMGCDAIKTSKRYVYRELSPRVHGMAYIDGTYFVSYDQYRPSDDRIYFVIAKNVRPSKRWTEVYRSSGLDVPYYALGGGGVMAASASEDRLYFTVGDYSLDRINHLPSDVAPQNPNLPFGKTNYINLKDDSYHLFTLGHRNQLGLVVLNDGRILESENGPKGGDELNVLREGKNYGWPYESYGTLYKSYGLYSDSLPMPSGQSYEQPIYVWTPSVAPTQLLQVAHFDRKWDGDLLMGSLEAKTLFNIKLMGDRVLFCEPIFIGARIRDLAQLGDTLMLLTDSGTIIEITKSVTPAA
jgi:glucose/arabinose dehydrogenase